jgi:alkylation response protein AidB-like acyl-CoA dehydrogenase
METAHSSPESVATATATAGGLDLTADQEAFRREAQRWLDDHLVGEFVHFTGREGPITDADADIRQRWERELGRGGWLGLGLPAEFGGRGATTAEQIVFSAEYARSRAPVRRFSVQGTELIGPGIATYGTGAQKARFLPGIISGEVNWGQGYSEPDAGSDLANVRTRAALDGDRWVINGQKTWTTMGTWADWIYTLVRTDPAEKKHRGLSMLLIPMHQPGVTTRPIRNIYGASEFAEVFFEDARTDVDLVLGEVDHGWSVALGILGFERGTATIPHQMQFERELDDIIDAARRRGSLADPVWRQRLVQAWIEVRILAISNQRKLSTLMREDGTLGPEASIAKLYWASMHQRLCELGVDVLGADGLLSAQQHDAERALAKIFLVSRAETIYGGSNEIQRNTLGERVLGLPKEPRP